MYYLSLCCLLGSGFACDPGYNWVKPVLSNTALLPLEKAESLWEQADQYIVEVVGDENQYLIAALFKWRKLQINQVPELENPQYDSVIKSLLTELYNQKPVLSATNVFPTQSTEPSRRLLIIKSILGLA